MKELIFAVTVLIVSSTQADTIFVDDDAPLVAPVQRFQIENLAVLPDWITSRATDITADGAVVGHGQTAGFDFRATIWCEGGVTDLGTLGGEDSVAYGANDLGQVVGYADFPDGFFHPVLWEEDLIQDLGTLGGGFGGHFARAANTTAPHKLK